jgi:peptide/nickel transport system permease protein
MLIYLAKRVIATIPVILIVALCIFALLNWAGGDPALLLAGDNASPEQIAAIRTAMGLDHSFFVRFGLWLGHVLRGDLGVSLLSRQPVVTLMAERVEPSLSLALCTLIFSVAVAIPLGIAAAARPGRWVDGIVTGISVIGFSIPVFVLSYVAIFVFALNLHWLPVQGYVSIREGIAPFLAHIALPSLSLSIAYIGWIAKVTRDSMVEVLQQDYIRTAAAKGAGTFRILFGHALKNAGAPIVTIVGIAFALLVGGVVVTETVFAIPGLGRLVVEAITQRDYPVIQGVVLFSSAAYIFVNLLVDLSYGFFDPRVRY